MSSLTRRPSGGTARRDAAEEALLDAVEGLLEAGHGYVELSVAEIAGAAGVARSTFYQHFADKSELLIRLASSRTADIFAAANDWVRGSGTDHGASRASLEDTCRRIVADYRRHVAVLDAVRAATGYDPVVADYWQRRIDVFVRGATEQLGAAQRVGRVDPDVDVRVLASLAAWSIERTVSQSVDRDNPEDDEALATGLARALWLMVFGDAPGNR